MAASLDEQSRASALSRALLITVYLFGARLSGVGALVAHEPTLLARAVRAVTEDLESKRYPLVQIIQAEVILAHYFLCMGRLSEGKYHIYMAVTLVFNARLHKIRSETSPTQDEDELPDPLQDAIEEGERINAFWTVYALDKEWADVSGSPSLHDAEYQSPLTLDIIDTPWPLDTETYEAVSNEFVSLRPKYSLMLARWG